MSQQPQETPPAFQGGRKTIIPVNTQSLLSWLQSIRSPLVLDKRVLEGVPRENLEHAIKIASTALAPWITEAGVIATISDPKAFEQDVMRKVTGIASGIRAIAMEELRKCSDAMELLEERARRGEPVEPGEALRKRIEECTRAIRHSEVAILAFLIAINVLVGAVQANLPPRYLSTLLTSNLGFVIER